MDSDLSYTAAYYRKSVAFTSSSKMTLYRNKISIMNWKDGLGIGVGGGGGEGCCMECKP